MVKAVQRLFFASVALLAFNSANAGDLFGAVQASKPASLERLSMADYRLPWLALADVPLDCLSTAYTTVAVSTRRRATAAPAATSSDAAALNRDWKSPVWTSGEVGFLYGQSVGSKHSFDTEQGYIFGTVGNDNIQITAGAAYERWNSRGWRGR
jgi:hypothetical protein